MNGRIDLLMAVITTICGAVAIAAAALLGHSAWGNYTWPSVAVLWCWLWYGATRTNRRLTGGAS